MALYLVAVPIGNPQDISLRALEILKSCHHLILEERKEGTQHLRAHGITGKTYLSLNEHSTSDDLKELLAVCQKEDVALITDAGTPGFCDPGADLVALCRKQNVKVHSVPGASSLMMLLSLSGRRLDQFLFRGFLPAENSAREKSWAEIKNEKRALILMDTPYRLQKMIEEIVVHFPERQVLLGLDFTQPTEVIWEGLGKNLKFQNLPKKAEFMVLVHAK